MFQHTSTLYLSTVFIWGSTFFAIKLQLGEVPTEVSVVYRFALALHAYVNRAYGQAAAALARFMTELERVGGSCAQNELFAQLQHDVVQRASGASLPIAA